MMHRPQRLLFFFFLLMLAAPVSGLQAKTDIFQNNGYLQKSSPYFNRPSPYFRSHQEKSWVERTMDTLREAFQSLIT